MVIRSVWLLHHKASLALNSPMNEDGSSFMLGIAVVPAPDMKAAILLFDKYLADKKMELLALWKCEQWAPGYFSGDTFADSEINDAATGALYSNKIYYTCGVSSEALDCFGDM